MATSPTRIPRRTETVHITIPADIRGPAGPLGDREKVEEDKNDSRALRRMERSNRAYQELLGSLYDAILVTAFDGRIIDVNDRAVHLLRYGRDDLSGMRVTDFVDGADHSLVDGLRESIEGGAFAVVEAWCVRQDGSDFPAEIAVHGINLTNEGQMCFMIRDISRRIQMERDVTRLTKAVASTRDAVAIFDAEGKHIYHNAAGEELLGLSDPEALQLASLLPDEALRSTVSDAIREGKGWSGEVDVPRQGGKTVPVLFRADAIELGDESAGAVAIMTDITQRRQDERKLRDTLRELERSNADLAQFAYVASHDLKEPLRAISGYLQLLDRRWGGQLTDMAQQYLHNALQGATRMKEMINHILQYSRLNPPSGPAEPVDSTGILTQVLANLGQLIHDRGAKVTVDDLPQVRVPPARLLQVFQNLIGNALKFCKEKPEVRVSAKTTREGVVFYVQDNGIGIDPAMVDRVFMLFQRLHTEREYEGTGIGLSTCRKLVEQWGGKIWVESSSPGTGTTFALSVPNDEGGEPAAD
jgi:PAS domain S-box-containing protein